MQKSIESFSLGLVCMIILLIITTAVNYSFFKTLNITGITLLYLLAVVTISYFCEFIVASGAALLAFLLINYFFIEPRYTFEVAHIESWVGLVCFLIVSIVVASLVKELKFQSLQSSIATKQARFARNLAEKLALATDIKQLLNDSCNLLKAEFNKPVGILQSDDRIVSYHFTIASDLIEKPNDNLIKWVADNGKPISPYTNYWSKSNYWLIPFSRMPSADPILVVGNVDNDDIQEYNIETYTAIKSCVDQISQSYQKLANSEQVKQVELVAQSEAIQSTLLASISHDMRTPLTSILGAATTLQQPNLDTLQTVHLSALIASQARYLASTTENILSLVQLKSHAQIPMDWQSPEEIIGGVITLYKNRGESVDLKVTINEPDLLIKGNASLLMQALVNLIDNACKANLYDQAIEILANKNDNRIDISVNDRGCGFSENFDATQIKKFSSGSAKGFGLGLSIVQAIAKSHNAIFTIHNREGGGICTTLSFDAPNIENIDVR